MKKIIIALFVSLIAFSSCVSDTKKANSNTQEKTSNTASNPNESIKKGEELYASFCSQCHLRNGKGINSIIPPLVKSDWLENKRTESIYAVKYGLQGEIEVNGVRYKGMMQPMGLSDKEIADVFNYIMTSWGNTQDKPVTAEEVAAINK